MMQSDFRILLVDDDPQIGHGLRRALRREFEIEAAVDAAAALLRLRDSGPFHVIVCDLSMPGMDGLTLLSHVRRFWPDVMRIMLTGEAQLHHAVEALNSELIFRFVLKPCAPESMRQILQTARAQWDLQRVERDIMEQTWRGSVRALMDVLALVQPATFGRADRLARLAEDFVKDVGVDDGWRVVTAARLTQLGATALSGELLQQLDSGAALTKENYNTLRNLPAVAARLLEHIPRLEDIRRILTDAAAGGPMPQLSAEASIVRLVLRLDALTSTGQPIARFLDDLSAEERRHPPAVVAAVRQRFQARIPAPAPSTQAYRAQDLTVGMILLADLRTPSGLLLAARGQVITAGLLDRIRTIWGQLGSDQLIQVEVGTPAPYDVSAPGQLISISA